MDDKHDPNASVPAGTFRSSADQDFEIDVSIDVSSDIVVDDTPQPRRQPTQARGLNSAILGSTPEFRVSDEQTKPDALPRRRRTSTLMGVPLPNAAGVSGPTGLDPATTEIPVDEISAAIDLLDEDTSVYGRDDRQLQYLIESEMTELPASLPPGEIVGVVSSRSDEIYELDVLEARDAEKQNGRIASSRAEPPRHAELPVLAPAQFVEARARDKAASASAREAAASSARDRAASALRSESHAAREAAKLDKTLREDRGATPQSDSARSNASTTHAQAVSSLAPTEIRRPAPAPLRKAAAKPSDSTSLAGFAMVAAMVLVGIGGWWLTSGGYERGQSPQPMAAAAPPSIVRPAAPRPEVAAVAQPAEPVAPTVATAAEPEPIPAELASSRPARPRGMVTKRSPAPAPAATPAVPAPTEGLAEAPSRSAVIAGLDGVRSSVQACADGRSGVAEVDVTIAANGVVTNALVGGDFRGTPQGSCIARAVRKARFPKFTKDSFRLLYPYSL